MSKNCPSCNDIVVDQSFDFHNWLCRDCMTIRKQARYGNKGSRRLAVCDKTNVSEFAFLELLRKTDTSSGCWVGPSGLTPWVNCRGKTTTARKLLHSIFCATEVCARLEPGHDCIENCYNPWHMTRHDLVAATKVDTPPIDTSLYMSYEDAATLLACTNKKILSLVRRGTLHGVNGTHVSRDSVLAMRCPRERKEAIRSSFNDYLADVFNRSVVVRGDDECWGTTRHVGKSGYVKIVLKTGKHTSLHKLSYIVHCGDVPAGMVVRHLCNNKACSNPKHLAVGTHADNMADLRQSGVMSKIMRSIHAQRKNTATVSLMDQKNVTISYA